MKFAQYLTEMASTKLFSDELVPKLTKVREDYLKDLVKQVGDVDDVSKVDYTTRGLSETFQYTKITFEYKGIEVEADFSISGYSLWAFCKLGPHEEVTPQAKSLRTLFSHIDRAIDKLEKK